MLLRATMTFRWGGSADYLVWPPSCCWSTGSILPHSPQDKKIVVLQEFSESPTIYFDHAHGACHIDWTRSSNKKNHLGQIQNCLPHKNLTQAFPCWKYNFMFFSKMRMLINYLRRGFGKCWNRNLTHNISLGHLLCFDVVRRQNLTQICAASVTFSAECESGTQRTRLCCMLKLDLLGAMTLWSLTVVGENIDFGKTLNVLLTKLGETHSIADSVTTYNIFVGFTLFKLLNW